MNLVEKFLKLITNNIYIFILSIIFLVILIYSISIIFALENINPFILGILISVGIGLILGLEREYDKLKRKGKKK